MSELNVQVRPPQLWPDLRGESYDHIKKSLDLMVSSELLRDVDDTMTSLILAQSAKRPVHKLHTPAPHSKDFVPPKRERAEEAKALVKKQMGEAGIKQLHSAAESCAVALLSAMKDLFTQSSQLAAVIEWWLSTYYLVIRKDSRVRLTKESMRTEDGGIAYRFGITARVDLGENECLFELAGLVPIDDNAEHTSLSEIHRSNHRQARLLAGPIRYINHVCGPPNAQYHKVENTYGGYIAITTRAIKEGERIMVNYDKDSNFPTCICEPGAPPNVPRQVGKAVDNREDSMRGKIERKRVKHKERSERRKRNRRQRGAEANQVDGH